MHTQLPTNLGQSPLASSRDSLSTTGYVISGEFWRSLHIPGGRDTQQLLSGMKDTTREIILHGDSILRHASILRLAKCHCLVCKHVQSVNNNFDKTRQACT